jgi:hypothetical protein
MKLEFRADIFNLLNAENLSGYSNNATQSNQGGGLFTKGMRLHQDNFNLVLVLIN